MKLVELKCKNCGAQLKVEEGTSQVKCEFCGSTFSVDDAYNEGYKYTKGVLKARSEQMEEDFNKAQDLLKNSYIGKSSRVVSIAFVAIFILIFGFIGYGIYTTFTDNEKEVETTHDSFEVNSFNTPYETDAGKRSGFFIVRTLDDIVTNNKTNKSHVITVVYNGITATKEKNIKEIRNMLSENKDYDVSLDYDSNGYVNKFTIEDIESNKIATESNTNTSNNNSSVQIPSVDDIDISSSEYEQIKEEMEQKLDEMKEAYNNR